MAACLAMILSTIVTEMGAPLASCPLRDDVAVSRVTTRLPKGGRWAAIRLRRLRPPRDIDRPTLLHLRLLPGGREAEAVKMGNPARQKRGTEHH